MHFFRARDSAAIKMISIFQIELPHLLINGALFKAANGDVLVTQYRQINDYNSGGHKYGCYRAIFSSKESERFRVYSTDSLIKSWCLSLRTAPVYNSLCYIQRNERISWMRLAVGHLLPPVTCACAMVFLASIIHGTTSEMASADSPPRLHDVNARRGLAQPSSCRINCCKSKVHCTAAAYKLRQCGRTDVCA